MVVKENQRTLTDVTGPIDEKQENKYCSFIETSTSPIFRTNRDEKRLVWKQIMNSS